MDLEKPLIKGMKTLVKRHTKLQIHFSVPNISQKEILDSIQKWKKGLVTKTKIKRNEILIQQKNDALIFDYKVEKFETFTTIIYTVRKQISNITTTEFKTFFIDNKGKEIQASDILNIKKDTNQLKNVLQKVLQKSPKIEKKQLSARLEIYIKNPQFYASQDALIFLFDETSGILKNKSDYESVKITF